MHFLTHMYLAGGSTNLLVGNFIGAIKTITNPTIFDEDLRQGILMQSLIDDFASKDEAVLRSRARLNSKYSKYSDFIIEVFYDHFLASEWSENNEISLEDFTSNCYSILMENIESMPYKAKCILPMMAKGNWMAKFRTIEGVHQTIREMDMRSTKLTHVIQATEDLIPNYSAFRSDFHEFFPRLVEFIHHNGFNTSEMFMNQEVAVAN